MDKALKIKIVEAIQNGLGVRGDGRPRGGCGRAYVCLSTDADKSVLSAYRAAIKHLGMMYLAKAYGSGKRALYVGYDNGTGVPFSQAEAIAANLRAIGVDAYEDGVGD